jgi:pyrroloquinoline quinone biosynthesis protein B
LALSADGEVWFLINASPDLRMQIEATSVLHPRSGLRSSPLAGVVITNGDVDAIAGLLTLRERHPFMLYATSRVHGVLAENPVFNVLAPDVVERRTVPLGEEIALAGPDGRASGLVFELFVVPGKVPLYLEGTETPAIGEGEETVGIRLRRADRSGDGSLFYIPSCAAMTPALASRLRGAPLVFFDGTLFTDDEMIRAGLGPKSGQRMGHMSMAGPNGTLAAFAGLEVARKIFIHINNSNPVLIDDTPERRIVEAAGWEVGFDGMDVRV